MALIVSNSLALPDDQWFPNGNTKTGICLHHTVGGTAVQVLIGGSATSKWLEQLLLLTGMELFTRYLIPTAGLTSSD